MPHSPDSGEAHHLALLGDSILDNRPYVAPQPDTAARLARVPLTLLNDQIIRIASTCRVDVLDLRTVCTRPSDFVKDIETLTRAFGGR